MPVVPMPAWRCSVFSWSPPESASQQTLSPVPSRVRQPEWPCRASGNLAHAFDALGADAGRSYVPPRSPPSCAQ
jgi:hypothetical protein